MSKTARIEEKLDGLVSMIKAGGRPGTVFTDDQDERVSSSDDKIRNTAVLTPATDEYSGSSHSLPPLAFLDAGYEPSPATAEEYLNNFRTHHLNYFPFVHIPSATNAHQLHQERPFLWLCIMAVGSKSTSEQQALGVRIQETIAQDLVCQSEKNIDLLLGILTFVGWYGVHRPRIQSCQTDHFVLGRTAKSRANLS
jgi:hypothetical protein